MQEEIFGPVVGFIKVNKETIDVANDTDYGLTGAVITNNREHWIKAVNEYDVVTLPQPWLYCCRSWISSIWWFQNVRYRR